eukprot:1089652-Pleurochrysis_carterae.AAC.1
MGGRSRADAFHYSPGVVVPSYMQAVVDDVTCLEQMQVKVQRQARRMHELSHRAQPHRHPAGLH